MKQNLSIQIIIGIIIGAFLAIYFPSLITYLKPIGTAFVMLMQMPVLLFMLCSIIVGIGHLDLKDGKLLFGYSLIFLLGSWLITRLSTFIIPLAFPPFHAVDKFSSPGANYQSISLIDTFIPQNPFKSLAQGSLSSVIVFAIFFAIALSRVKKPTPLLNSFKAAQEAAMIIVNWIVKLSLLGSLCLSASATQSIAMTNIPEIRFYYYAFIFGTIFVSSLLIPLIVTIFTPTSYRQLMSPILPALLLAFISGNAVITLPLVLSSLQRHMPLLGFDKQKFRGFINTLVPLTFTFPISAKLFNVLFIYFTSWYYSSDALTPDIIELSTLSLLTSFGSSPEGIGYLLDSVHLPKDAIDLFIPTMPITAKFMALANVASIVSMCFFTVSSWEKRLTFNFKKLLITLAIATMGYGAWFLLINSLNTPVPQKTPAYLRQNISDPLPYKIIEDIKKISPLKSKHVFSHIKKSKTLRVGFSSDNMPYSYFNAQHDLVGFDIELMHGLAKDLGLRSINFVNYQNDPANLLESGLIDIAVSALRPQKNLLNTISISQPYLIGSYVLITPDYLNSDAKNIDPNTPIFTIENFQQQASQLFPHSTIKIIKNIQEFLIRENPKLLLWALPEALTITTIYPQYSIIEDDRFPSDYLTFAAPSHTDQWTKFINNWIELKKSQGVIEQLYKKWFLFK
ncbi:MAG: cation:dicarboxylase symporter family transporter [Myxococcales bacterium]|nr:cation:dicarboxylase symporter family transporter [Myxococcales bacterium]USN50088.1 MAG: cation:dicarboxylase symporter family transporter [Myxococcales bacterium]